MFYGIVKIRAQLMKSEIYFDRPNFVDSEEKAYTRMSDPDIIDFTNVGSYIHARLPRLNTFLPSHMVSEFPTARIPHIFPQRKA